MAPWTAFDRAEKARTQLENALYGQLRAYGRAAHVTDPAERLATVIDELAVVERDLRTATAPARLQAASCVRRLDWLSLKQRQATDSK